MLKVFSALFGGADPITILQLSPSLKNYRIDPLSKDQQENI